MLALGVILAVSGALLVGAAWGIFGRLPERVEGFVVALAGGSLLVSTVVELIEPGVEEAALWSTSLVVLAGALVFVVADWLVDERWGSSSGGGLLAAITLDGIPENLALGVALIGVEPAAAAGLAGSILLSNLPEAAGGAKEMAGGDRSNGAVFGLWAGAAALLAASAVAGYLLLDGVPDSTLALIRGFAGGAVVASLASEVFPKAFKEDSYLAGLATALGVVTALGLGHLG
ncbi:MAG: hypothetical protein KDB04_18785 [Acidimicrobiales bacterium]|nr:hypothetical protein [Acidimicrobiales bacterium]HRW39873.1 hypothetical protein [Aquihabitans sp.]